MATINKVPIEVARTTTGAPAYVLSLPEAASQTFKTGAPLVFDASGYIVEATTASSTNRFAGIALEPGHNGTQGQYNVLCAVANSTTVFSVNCDAATTAIMVGRSFGLEKDGTTGTWMVDTSAGTGNRTVIVQAFDSRDAIGDTNGRLHVIFNASRCALTYTS